MPTWLTKIARAGAFAASNQFLGTNSMSSPGAGVGAMAKTPFSNTSTKLKLPGPMDQNTLANNTSTTLNQETITHGDSQNKVNTAPITPQMIHPIHPIS